jgi:hypothetical protein
MCPICHDKYYVCRKCISINSYKNVCCSIECYKKYLESVSKDSTIKSIIIGDEDMNQIVMRAGLNNKLTIDITGYDLSTGKFDCTDNTTKEIDDFEYFIIPRDELKAIIKDNNISEVKSTKSKTTKIANKE